MENEVADKRNVIIFSSDLLPQSETFILAQGEGLQRYTPYYVGIRRVSDGLSVPPERTIVIGRSKWAVAAKAQKVLFRLLKVMPGLYTRLSKLQPMLVHAHFGPNSIYAMSISKYLQVPLIVTFHGVDTNPDQFLIQRSFVTRDYVRNRKKLMQYGRLFIAVSEFMKSKLIEKGFSPESVIVHYIGIDNKLFRRDPMVERSPMVLFVGRLVEYKGCEYLIKAMAKVQALRPDVKLVVVGDGELRASLQRQAADALQNYTFMGWQTSEQVRDLMNRAKVFCAPSFTINARCSEAFGIVFAEAQAMGLPVVSFKTGGIQEAVSHEETGFLAPERDWEKLADYILIMFNNENLWTQFSYNGQRRVEDKFNLTRQNSLLEGLYDSVIQT
ncbi:MAG: glycosyltransferase [Nitrospirae bacterium]|nr:glycosyltransferase [Nitrospirota bacterium]